jgi:sugar (pentulose or hexulose) kinase
MKNEYALTLDFGTQSVRAMIFDDKGNSLGLSKVQYHQPYFSSKPGYAEQDPNYYLDCMYRATNNIVKAHPELISGIVGCTITTFRDSAVLLDNSFKVIRPSILWLDQRQAACPKPYPFLKKCILNLVGMSETVKLNRARTMSNWIQENEPENWEKTAHYWALSTFFIYKLTKKTVDTASSYTGHYPINMKKGKWDTKNSLTYDIYNIDTSLLPELVPAGSLIGTITKEASKLSGLPQGLSLYAGGADKNCESLGVGCIDNKIASISYGTASSIEVINKKYIEPESFLPAYSYPAKNLYALEVQVYRGYWMLQWFSQNFASEEVQIAKLEQKAVEAVLNEKIMNIPAGSEGLILQPYWGPGLKRPMAKGMICGFSDYHTKYHVYKSIIEGIGYALREGLDSIEKRQHSKVKEIRASGGGSKSNAVCQITADIFNKPVSRVQTFETASLGCAIIVFVASNHFSSFEEAIKQMVHIKDTFLPNNENAEVYENIYRNVYLNIYPHMKKINLNIRKYSKKK